MYSEILRKQLSQQDKVYNKFVYDIHSRIRQYKKDNFYKSVRLERRNRDLIDDELTFDMVVRHIEHEKAKQIHSEKFRFVHSDISGQHLSNSINQASILSPDSNSFGQVAQRVANKVLKKKYPHYNSFSIGLINSNNRIFTLPDLKHRYRNSLCNLRDMGWSEGYSNRLGHVINKASSNSNHTTPLTGNSLKNNPKSRKTSNNNNTKTPRAFEQPKASEIPMSLQQLYKGNKL